MIARSRFLVNARLRALPRSVSRQTAGGRALGESHASAAVRWPPDSGDEGGAAALGIERFLTSLYRGKITEKETAGK